MVSWTTKSHARRGTAFIELLVVMGIIALLVAILVPMFLHARQRATSHQCTDNLRQLGQAMLAYAGDNRGRFPMIALPSKASDPLPERVSAAMFLLLQRQNLSPTLFTCPASGAVPDDFGGSSPLGKTNFADIRRNLSYSMQNPYAGEAAESLGFTWSTSLPPDFAIMADLNPATPGLAESFPGIEAVLPCTSVFVGNSNNHDGMGQNVLYADGRIEFQNTPYSGAAGDHIYLSRNNRVLEGPQDGADSILLPSAN